MIINYYCCCYSVAVYRHNRKWIIKQRYSLQVQDCTLASNYLNVGDRILEIDGIDCYSLTESQAISFLRRPSNSIELLVLKRRGENVVPPKRSSSCKALTNFTFPKPHSISEPNTPLCQQSLQSLPEIVRNSKTESQCALNDSDGGSEESTKQFSGEAKPDLDGRVAIKNQYNGSSQFSNFRPRRNSLQKDGENVCLKSRPSSPQFWKLNTESSSDVGRSSDCKSFWKKLEKCSMEDLSARHTPSPIRPASVAFYPKTPEPIQPNTEVDSPKKKVIPKYWNLNNII